MIETVLQVYRKGKVIAALGMNSMPNFRFMQKVHLENWTYDKTEITSYKEVFGRVWRVKHKLITTTNYEGKQWKEPDFKTIVELHLF